MGVYIYVLKSNVMLAIINLQEFSALITAFYIRSYMFDIHHLFTESYMFIRCNHKKRKREEETLILSQPGGANSGRMSCTWELETSKCMRTTRTAT